MLNCHFINARVQLLTRASGPRFCHCCFGSACSALLKKKIETSNSIVNIHHLFWQPNKQYKRERESERENSHLQLSLTTLHCMCCKQEWIAVVLRSNPRGEWFGSFQLFPAVRRQREWYEAGLLKTVLRYSVHIVCSFMQLQWTENSLQDWFWRIFVIWWLLL